MGDLLPEISDDFLTFRCVEQENFVVAPSDEAAPAFVEAAAAGCLVMLPTRGIVAVLRRKMLTNTVFISVVEINKLTFSSPVSTRDDILITVCVQQSDEECDYTVRVFLMCFLTPEQKQRVCVCTSRKSVVKCV